jgi:hypothetical protein
MLISVFFKEDLSFSQTKLLSTFFYFAAYVTLVRNNEFSRDVNNPIESSGIWSHRQSRVQGGQLFLCTGTIEIIHLEVELCIFGGERIFLWQLILKLSMSTSFHIVQAPMISLARFKNEKIFFIL